MKSADRFASRAENYARYRPDYAPAAIEAIFEQAGMTSAVNVADIGSGTGLVSRHFLERGHTVYAVEPNQQMREAAEARLGHFPGFHSIAGSSEATSLPDACIDLIVAGQAIGWFDGEPTLREFARVTLPDGWLAVLQHARPANALISEVRQTQTAENGWSDSDEAVAHQIRPIEWWFREGTLTHREFPNPRRFTLEALIGLELSNSHAPDENHPALPRLEAALSGIFERHQQGGEVTIDYTTHLYLGRLWDHVSRG